MYRFGRGFESRESQDVDSILREVRNLLNRIDELAKTTGIVLNSCGVGNDKFSENVSQWLFKKPKESEELKKLQNKLDEQASDNSLIASTSQTGGVRLENQEDGAPSYGRYCSSVTSYAETTNLTTSYFTSQLLSHNLTSNSNYRSPRSRYLECQALEVTKIREKLSAMNARSTYSACDLVGAISSNFQPQPKEQKKNTAGTVITMSGGSYASVRSCVDKSKVMFQDGISPGNPHFVPPWERRRNGRIVESRRFIL